VDEPQILRVMKTSLPSYGCEVIVAANGSEALELVKEQLLDLIILDLIMPGLSGFEVYRIIRQTSEVPIIILSARGVEFDKTSVLELGANDYITKPFSFNDLLVRIRVALRRISNVEIEKGVLNAGEITIDFSSKKVFAGGIEVKLTPKEYDIVIYLMNNAGKLVTRQDLLYCLWGAQLRLLINQLRNKIEPNPKKTRYILNEPGVVYTFCG